MASLPATAFVRIGGVVGSVAIAVMAIGCAPGGAGATLFDSGPDVGPDQTAAPDGTGDTSNDTAADDSTEDGPSESGSSPSSALSPGVVDGGVLGDGQGPSVESGASGMCTA